ncbi:hypothetical protein COS83_04740 [archaeon CG07_land_8_20_14_0_80_38_8]|nr:MAG: hypothetical protein COS83_04740 [archaeon CG07_land_8_20_14_0_80_38_8]
MNLLTHVLFGLAIGEVLNLELAGVILGSVLPDFDYLIGITHRTFTHSLLFILLISLIFYKKDKRFSTSLLIGFASHLLLDAFTTQGIMLLYPLNNFYSYNLFDSSSTAPNLLVIIFSLIIFLNKDVIQHKLSRIGSRKVRLFTYSFLLIPLFAVIPYYYWIISQCASSSIPELLAGASEYEGKCVSINALVCSENDYYSSSAGTDYVIFDACSDNDSLTVWMLDSFGSPVINDNITIIGIFTSKFYETSGYELYKIMGFWKN